MLSSKGNERTVALRFAWPVYHGASKGAGVSVCSFPWCMLGTPNGRETLSLYHRVLTETGYLLTQVLVHSCRVLIKSGGGSSDAD